MNPMTEEKFQSRLKLRAVCGGIIGGVGLVLFVLALVLGPAPQGEAPYFIHGFYVGTGGGLAGAGLVTMAKSLLYLRNMGWFSFQKAYIKENDERNQYVAMRAGCLSYWASMYMLYLATVAMGLVSFSIFITLLCALVLLGVTGGIIHLVCQKLH